MWTNSQISKASPLLRKQNAGNISKNHISSNNSNANLNVKGLIQSSDTHSTKQIANIHAGKTSYDKRQKLPFAGSKTLRSKTALPATANKRLTTANPWHISFVDPLLLDVRHRFDIIVKTVYAVFYRRKAISPFVKQMYLRHEQVWNGFREGCGHKKGIFDSTRKCKRKTSAKDFIDTFHDTISSIAVQGFNTSVSLIPMSNTGYFPYNGAHRWATAIALGLKSIPVQRLATKGSYEWGKEYFLKLGLEQKYVDFALQQWALHVKNSTVEDEYWLKFVSTSKLSLYAVVVFPLTKYSFQNKIVEVINREIADAILVQRYIYLNTSTSADMFVQHIYAKEPWAWNGGSWAKTKSCFPKGSENVPTWVLFIQSSKSLSLIKSSMERMRNMLQLDDNSLYISETNEETISVAKLTLNKNSITMLHRNPWSTVADRKKHGPCVPSMSQNETQIYYLDTLPCAM